MKEYLRAIGFGSVDADSIVEDIVNAPDDVYVVGSGENDTYFEYAKRYHENYGVMLRGKMGEDEKVYDVSFSPYGFSGKNMQVTGVSVKRHEGRCFAYAEDKATGNVVIFEAVNRVETLKSLNKPKCVNVAGLSVSGTVLLPVMKSENYAMLRKRERLLRRFLIEKARAGDSRSEKILTARANDSLGTIFDRIKEDDFFTVVDGFILPGGKYENVYSILADIQNVETVVNPVTSERVVVLSLSVTDIEVDVFINEEDVFGMPMKGMRFFGSVRFSGKII